jgi:hypothetical protein
MTDSGFQHYPDFTAQTPQEVDGLLELARTAQSYVRSFAWCPPLLATYLAFGVSGVIGLFQVHFEQTIQKTDDRLWVIVGDLPSAYLVVNESDLPRDALENYCLLMDEWVDAVRDKSNFETVFPISSARTLENAGLLMSRIGFIRSQIVPELNNGDHQSFA